MLLTKQITMFIIAIAWIYVVLLMSLTEQSIVAGLMTFLFYCVVPLSIILYLIGAPGRKRSRLTEKNSEKTNDESLDQLEKPMTESDHSESKAI